MSGFRTGTGARTKTSNQDQRYAYGAQIPQMITAATKARRDREFTKYLGQIGMTKDAFLRRLNSMDCDVNDFYTYLDALTLADENPDGSLEDLIGQLSTVKIGGGGMRQVGGSLGALLALHIKIFKSQNFANFSRLSLGAIVQLIQSTIDLLNSLDECFVYYGGVFIKSAVGGMMGLCKYLYDNREDIKDGAKTGASAVGSAMKTGATVGATVGADVLIATPGVILNILRGVDDLAMRFAAEYNPKTNGFDEILDAVKRRNDAHHAMMAQLATEQEEAAGKETKRTMELEQEQFNAQQEVDSMTAIREASEAARTKQDGLIGNTARLNYGLTMGVVGKGKDNGKSGALKAFSGKPVFKHRPKKVLQGFGPEDVPAAAAGAGARRMDQSDDDFDVGGKRATRKRGKRSSKRGSRKTKTTRKKTTRKKTTRKKRRGKK